VELLISIFVGDGRLGNQVFQFVAIRKRLGDGTLWTPNLRALGKIFKVPLNVKIFLTPEVVEKLLRRIICPVFVKPLFKWLRLGTYCYEPMGLMSNGSCDPSGDMVIQPGVLPVTFVEGGFYQNFSDLLSPDDFRFLTLRDDVLAAARAVVGKAIGNRPLPRAVMHVRRGDYVGYSAYGLDDVLLPVAYYKKAVAIAREYLGTDAEILVVTDDPAWCKEVLEALHPFTVVSGTEAVDFALLSMFPVAILSNSTFSLAASCVGPEVERIIGPEFWFGHAVKQWYPPQIRARDARFVYV